MDSVRSSSKWETVIRLSTWLFAAFMALGFIGALMAKEWIMAFVALSCAIVILPPAANILLERFSISFSWWVKVVIVFALLAIGGAFVPQTNNRSSSGKVSQSVSALNTASVAPTDNTLPSEMTEDNVAPKCATAIDKVLRDPDSAEYKYRERVVTKLDGRNNWIAILPVRARNAFGAYVVQRFVCKITAGAVTDVAKYNGALDNLAR